MVLAGLFCVLLIEHGALFELSLCLLFDRKLDVLVVVIRLLKRLFLAAAISLVVWERVERLELSEHRDEHDDDKEIDGDEREDKELELGSSEHSDSLDEALFKLAARLRLDEFVELL